MYDYLEQRIIDAIEENSNRIKQLSLNIFNNPETANKEYLAADILTKELEAHGFTIKRGLKGIKPVDREEVILDTAFKARAPGKKTGPNIALILEYDALPTGHACGHNLICAAGLSAALGLKEVMGEVQGNLLVFGTPAEEGALTGNKTEMTYAGHFADVDVILANHPGDRWDPGANWLAFSKGTINFHGKASHAASAPEQGINALKAAYLFFNGVDALREHIREDARLHGIITQGGNKSNMVPEFAQVMFAVRAFDKPYVNKVVQRVTDIIEGACLMTGARADYSWGYAVNAPLNVPSLVELTKEKIKQVGIESKEIRRWTAYASTDLGEVGITVPTMNLFYSAAPPGTGLHTEEMLKAVKEPIALDAMITASKVIALTAYQIFTSPALLKEIKAEFSTIKEELFNG